MKVSGIISGQKGAHIWLTSDGKNGIHIWFKKFVVEYVRRDWTDIQFRNLVFLDAYDSFNNSFKGC
jgi:hypothetical protein